MSNTRKNLLRRAPNLVVVDDGAYRWVGSSRQIYGWLAKHGMSRGFHSGHNTPNSVVMNSAQYQSMCDETQCLVDTSGSYGPIGENPYGVIGTLLDHDAALLMVY